MRTLDPRCITVTHWTAGNYLLAVEPARPYVPGGLQSRDFPDSERPVNRRSLQFLSLHSSVIRSGSTLTRKFRGFDHASVYVGRQESPPHGRKQIPVLFDGSIVIAAALLP
jgi:hypothetical protein